MGVSVGRDIFEDVSSDLVYMLGGLGTDGEALFGAVLFFSYFFSLGCSFYRNCCSLQGEILKPAIDFLEAVFQVGGCIC